MRAVAVAEGAMAAVARVATAVATAMVAMGVPGEVECKSCVSK